MRNARGRTAGPTLYAKRRTDARVLCHWSGTDIEAPQLGQPVAFGPCLRGEVFFTIGAHPKAFEAHSDTSKAHVHLPVYHWDNAGEMVLPQRCKLVGIELIEGATDAGLPPSAARGLCAGARERRAFGRASSRCDHIIKFPTAFCINVAMAGAIVMYDRVRSLGTFQTGWLQQRRRLANLRQAGSGVVSLDRLPGHWQRLGVRRMGIFKMRARLLLSATLMAALAPVAAAQDYQTQQQPAQPLPPRLQPAKPKPPAVVVPKPKPAAAPAPRRSLVPRFVAAPATPKARLLEKLGDWSVFIYEDASGRVCFAASAPTDMQPKAATAKRTPVVFYVTAWPKEGIRTEVSVKLGYPIKPKSAAAVTPADTIFRCLPTTTRPTQRIRPTSRNSWPRWLAAAPWS